jgi:Leucine-rich repeat (LRR) protein
VEVHISEARLKLRDFSEAAAPCRSIDLTVRHSPIHVVDLADLDPVVASLHSLICRSWDSRQSSLIGASVLSRMSQLTALHLASEDLGGEEPWGFLAKMTGLQQLHLSVSASGDPSPLSALTRLSSLKLQSLTREADGQSPFSFSSLRPLNALQHLKVLHLYGHACAATSLEGLAGLSNQKLRSRHGLGDTGGGFKCLEEAGPGVVDLFIGDAQHLVSFTGVGACTGIQKLSLANCQVPSLQPLAGLGSLEQLEVYFCSVTSLDSLDSMSLQSVSLRYCNYLTHLSGAQHFSALKSLEVLHCGLTSLQPLSQLWEGLERLRVSGCHSVQEEVLELPHVQPSADVVAANSNVREVVLAGGVRIVCIR